VSHTDVTKAVDKAEFNTGAGKNALTIVK